MSKNSFSEDVKALRTSHEAAQKKSARNQAARTLQARSGMQKAAEIMQATLKKVSRDLRK